MNLSITSLLDMKEMYASRIAAFSMCLALVGAEEKIWETTINDLLDRHDPKIPPDFERNFATAITVQLFILSFDTISEASMDYSISVFLRQTWTDHRMKYKPLDGIDMLEIDPRVMSNVWVPDLYFVNEKRATFHEVTVPNKMLQIYPDGEMHYSARISMTLSCIMGLQKFPFDRQVCSVMMESYSYSMKNVFFKWHQSPIETRDKLVLPQFVFSDTITYDCSKQYEGSGNFTCIRADFHLSRNYGYYMAQVYVPSILIVILSWVSFWLDIEAVPARISLGLLTVLTMTTQSANARAHLPRVSYVKAIDVWMATCLFFVFAALIEFAYVNVNARVERRRTAHQHGQNQGGLKLNMGQSKPVTKSETETDDEGKPKRLFSKTTIGRAKARRLDKFARILFPGVFIVFNIGYWCFYMLWEPELNYD